jgi:hypothetical protein
VSVQVQLQPLSLLVQARSVIRHGACECECERERSCRGVESPWTADAHMFQRRPTTGRQPRATQPVPSQRPLSPILHPASGYQVLVACVGSIGPCVSRPPSRLLTVRVASNLHRTWAPSRVRRESRTLGMVAYARNSSSSSSSTKSKSSNRRATPPVAIASCHHDWPLQPPVWLEARRESVGGAMLRGPRVCSALLAFRPIFDV